MSGPPSPGRRIRGLDAEQRRARRREDLLDGALDLFASQGYTRTTIEQICQHAHVGTKSFYEVFESRETCYQALLSRVTETAMGAALATLEDGADETTVSERLLASLAHSFVDDVRVARVTFGEGSAQSPAVERQRRENRRMIAAFITELWQGFGDDTTQPAIAIGLVGGLLDIIADWTLEGHEREVETLTDGLSQFYWSVRRGMTRTN